MKFKRFAFIMAIFVLALAMVGCSKKTSTEKKDSLAGTYVVTKASDGKDTFEGDKIKEHKLDCTLELKEDGKGTLTYPAEANKEAVNLTWKQTDKGLTLNDGKADIEATVDNGVIKFQQDGFNLDFTKK